MVHRLNHQWLAPVGPGKCFFCHVLLRLGRIKSSQVMSMVKFSPIALNFGYSFVLLVHFLGHPVYHWSFIAMPCHLWRAAVKSFSASHHRLKPGRCSNPQHLLHWALSKDRNHTQILRWATFTGTQTQIPSLQSSLDHLSSGEPFTGRIVGQLPRSNRAFLVLRCNLIDGVEICRGE